jgi:L-asparaginase
MSIQILITGGTFDKEYNELTGELFFKDSHLQDMLKRGRSSLNIQVRTLMMQDSLDITDNDREIILNSCKAAKGDKILITHGTDSMDQTARYLNQHIKDKTIILTGAMIPYVFGSSDGLFNLGASLAYVQMLPYGVYIAMNGRVYNAENVRKNKDKGFFEEINP